MPTTQKQSPQFLGWAPPWLAAGTASLALNAANTWLAFSFVAPEGLTLSKVRTCISALAGSGSITCTAELYSDSSGNPGTSIQAATGNPTLTVAGYAAAIQEWTGFSTLLTAATRYWIVFKNTTAAPGTNYPTFRFGGADTWARIPGGNTALWGMSKLYTTDGTTWGTAQSPLAGLRLEFSDSGNIRYAGAPLLNINVNTNYSVYGMRECGVKFTTPANSRFNVRGLAFNGSWNASAASLGNARFRLYAGDSLLATSALIPVTNWGTTFGWRAALFSAPQTLAPNTVHRVTLGVDAGGDASNYYRMYYLQTGADANDYALFPWSMQGCYFNGSTWDDSLLAYMFSWALILDTDGEFGSQGGVHYIIGA